MPIRHSSKALGGAEASSSRLKGLGAMLSGLRPGNRRGADATRGEATADAPEDSETPVAEADQDSSLVMAPEEPEQLQQFLIDTVAELCGMEPADVSLEEDGSIAVTGDHCLMIVQRSGGDTAILVSAYLFKDLKTTPEALELLNMLNADCLFGRFYLEDEVLIYEDGYLARLHSRTDLIAIFDLFDEIAAEFMGKIHERLGGTPIVPMEREDEIDV